jgi:hypothetical protein
MARKTNSHEAIAMLEAIMRADGREPCEQCSKPNWVVWHKPGEHVPVSGETLDKVGKKAKLADSIGLKEAGRG